MSHRGRSDGSGMINNVNGFAALSGSRKKKSKGKSTVEKAAVEQKTFWAPAPLNAKSWADVDDDDDDYYATTAPPQSVWGLSGQQPKERTLLQVEESESDDDILGEGDNLDEEHDSEPEVQEDPEPMVKSFAPAMAMAVKEPEKQLSKKEIRKRELKELDALLADLNITPNEKNDHDEHQGAEVDKKELQRTEEEELNESGPVESKNSKRKKKKAKSSKELKEIQNQSAREETNAEEDTATVDVKEQLKKLAAMKKRKPSKETDTAAKAAAAEAAARRQKLEAAKKKEKSHHYNQQPLSLISIHAALPSEQYWNSMLPATPMPRAITLALRPGHGAIHMMLAGNDGYGNSGYQNNEHVVAEPKEVLKLAGNDGYGNSNYQNNEHGVAEPVKALKLAGNDGYGNSDYSINGRHAATDPLTGMKIVAVNPPTALFFLEKDLYPGKEMSLEINRRENSASTFIPLRVSDSIPFSSDKLSTIFDKFSVKPESKEAELMKRTLNMCSLPAGKGEKKQCVTSLESMVDFTIASLGKNIQAISTEAEKDTKLQKFKIIDGIKKLANDEAVVCHKETYPYAVFLCHDLKATRSYLVPLIGADGTKAKATAVCHIDTSGWNPEHLALRVLGVKAGTVPVCHFLPEYDVVWTKK